MGDMENKVLFRMTRKNLNGLRDILFPQTVDTNVKIRNEAGLLSDAIEDYDEHVASPIYHTYKGTSTGSASALNLDIPGITLTDSLLVLVKLHADVLANATLNFNNLGPSDIVLGNLSSIKAGAKAGSYLALLWNSDISKWIVIGDYISSVEEPVYNAIATSLPENTTPTVNIMSDGQSVTFTFGIPKGDVGETGAVGEPGVAGPAGVDGVSPTIVPNPANDDTTYKLDITDKNGMITTENLKGSDGIIGSNGVDGISPTIIPNPANDDTTYKLDITDKNGMITTENLKGANGLNGEPGPAGVDGISPTIVENPANDDTTYKLDITDKNGTITTPNLKGSGTTGGETLISPLIVANAYNTESVYKLDITDATGTFTTPNLKGTDGTSGGGESSGSGIAPADVTGVLITSGNECLNFIWNDPEDIYLEGATICKWKGTKIVIKIGSYPESVTDGTLVIDNQTRDAYVSTAFTVPGLIGNTTYYIRFFPYSDTGAINYNAINEYTCKVKRFLIMGVAIDLSNPNPETSVTYTDDAVGLTPGSTDWDAFFGHYPVLLQKETGVELGVLNRNDFSKFADGTDAKDIYDSESPGDIMIAFPRRGLRISKSNGIVSIQMTDNPNDDTFKYYAHSRGSVLKDTLYIASFLGRVYNTKLRSVPQAPYYSETITSFRTWAKNNGPGYDIMAFYQWIYIQCVYLLKFKNLDSQTAISLGKSNYSSVSSPSNCHYVYGMDFELYKTTYTNYNDGLRDNMVLGLSNFWGNSYPVIDGIIATTSALLIGTENFNDNGDGYTNMGVIPNVSGFMTEPVGTTELGFLPAVGGGSATTNFCDTCNYLVSTVKKLPRTGGGCQAGVGGFYAGIFYLDLQQEYTNKYYTTARLMYL